MPELHEIYDEAEKLKDEGKLEEAAVKYREILESDENYAMAHFALAVVCGRLGDHEKAVAHAEKAAQLEPSDPLTYTVLSVTYQQAFEATRDERYIMLAEEAKARAHQR